MPKIVIWTTPHIIAKKKKVVKSVDVLLHKAKASVDVPCEQPAVVKEEVLVLAANTEDPSVC